MAATVPYAEGWQYLPAEWTVGTFEALLLKTPFDPDPSTQTFVGDIVADELTVAGYARDTITTPTVTIPATNDRQDFGCDDLDFGMGIAGETALYLAIYRFVTNDADSEIVCVFPVLRVTDGTSLLFAINGIGALRFATYTLGIV